MKKSQSLSLKGNEFIVKKAIDFFTSFTTNKDLFEDIKTTCLKVYETNRTDLKKYSQALGEMGFLSPEDFCFYHWDKKTDFGQSGNGIDLILLSDLAELLTDYNLLQKYYYQVPDFALNRFRGFGKYLTYVYEKDQITNLIFGWKYIHRKFHQSVFKIVPKFENGDSSIGTGFFTRLKLENGTITPIIITNKHILEGSKSFLVLDSQNKLIEISKLILSENKDLAAIILKKDISDIQSFNLSYTHDLVLSEIITMGYPSVPLTKDSFLLSHKGEINSVVEDVFNNEFFLFSAKTSSGNSGDQ